MSTADLHDVIEDSLTDAELPEVPELASPDGAPEPTEVPAEPVPDATPAPETPPADPAAPKAEPEEVDEFQKKFGIAAREPGGRENRIPYSRVKKISEKAVSDARKEWESSTTPRMTEFEGKVKDYEERLGRVAEFENVMVGDPDKFLTMLSGLPAYKEFFDQIRLAFSIAQQATPDGYPFAPNGSGAAADDGMPAPDQELSDGTTVYSMDGLKKLLKWQADQVESRVTKKYEERYKPIESEWQARERVNAIIPKVRAQIDEARTWHLFNENEAEIVKALQDDQRLSLEGAYRKIVFPKITTDRNKMREDILKEVKSAPRSTSAATGAARGATPAPTGPRSLEAVIEESIKALKR